MARKQYFALFDTETTIEDTVADFAMLICDRHGEIFARCAVLVRDHYDCKKLFHDKNANDIWGYAGLKRREENYRVMLADGKRMLASAAAINRWIDQAIGKYNPMLTAYNVAFDLDKCKKTGIELSGFNSRFCLWQAAVGNICHSKKYRQFCLDHHLFNAPTQHGNMTFKTNAEAVCGFIRGEFLIEPHTALEDAQDFELPILQYVVNRKNWRDNVMGYDWKKFQVKDHYLPK